jgi:hypothetical protein
MDQSSTRGGRRRPAFEALPARLSPDFTVISSRPWNKLPQKFIQDSNILRHFPHVKSALHLGHMFWKSAAPAGFSLV